MRSPASSRGQNSGMLYSRFVGGALVCLLGLLGPVHSCLAKVLSAKNGMVLEGELGYLASISENPLVQNAAPGADIKQIVLLDDGLRRTYLSDHQVVPGSLRESDPNGLERIRIRQNVANGKREIGSVAAILGIGPFDEYGRRTFSILTPRGAVDIVQGITEITPLYTRLEGLDGHPSIRWDCRVATSSIPRETIRQVLQNQGVEFGVEARMQLVRLLFKADRFHDAQLELQAAMQEYPELGGLEDLLNELRQLSTTRLIDEIEMRSKAGQHARARTLLSQFPAEGVAQEILLRVSEQARSYQRLDANRELILQSLGALTASLKDATSRAQAEAVGQEIQLQLNYNSVLRLQDFLRLADDRQLSDESRLSLLISGWVLGTGAATQNLIEALSVVRVRERVEEYLSTATPERRTQILEELGLEEGATPIRVRQIIQEMQPPVPTDPQPDRPVGNFRLQVPGVRESDVYEYEVQLPDEYDPSRRYPAIVTLHGGEQQPGDQIDWWAGVVRAESGARVGQAGRHGYVVIAPHWTRENQRRYEYTAQEHAIVLASLRDACRRFAIDTDRVFLSGHSLGGDAAWDLGVAHPDIWAGLIPIVAVCDYGPNAPKYISQYWEHMQYLPAFFVIGELDGNRLEMNRRDFDRYLKRVGMDVILVEYRGRGHEHFFEEIHRIFSWMNLQRRDFNRDDFTCATMRSSDNFFWYLELQGLPPASLVSPLLWSDTAAARPAVQEFQKTVTNKIMIKTGAEQAWLWLTPELIDLTGKLQVNVNGKSRLYDVSPAVETLLEDARTRVDRQHPFWARLELTTGKRAGR